MTRLPPEFSQRFRAANDIDVRVLSYGKLEKERIADPTGWEETRKTLDDQAIFGTRRAFLCACGKFCGEDNDRLVCDICGVKVASLEGRRIRFAHIDLGCEIAHPFDIKAARLTVWPVLPAACFESTAGAPLAGHYDALISASNGEDALRVRSAVWKICDFLLPVVRFACDWDLGDTVTLARGLALEPQSQDL